MSTLKALRTRIKSVKATQKITTAMKLVSASKLRRAQEQLESYKDYAHTFEYAWQSALRGCEKDELPQWLLPKEGDGAESELVVVFMADRGLCGSYNAQIARHVRQLMVNASTHGHSVKLLPVGFKALDFLRKDFQGSFLTIPFENRDKKPTIPQILGCVGDYLVNHLNNTQYTSVKLLFTEFHTILRQEIAQHELLINMSSKGSEEGNASSSASGYGPFLEPNASELLTNLASMYVMSKLRYALYQSQASEQGARMRAMDAATENAKDLITRLNRTYNRTRQAGITRELIEIISGANALAS